MGTPFGGRISKGFLDLPDANLSTSYRAGSPAEFKHINKRRKRNQRGCPQ